MKKNKNGIVYSTDADFDFDKEEHFTEADRKDQKLRVMLDRKQRGGKIVTLVTGFQLKDEDLQQLAKELKTACGSGGSAKDGEILVQGDHREKVLNHLKKIGFAKSKMI